MNSGTLLDDSPMNNLQLEIPQQAHNPSATAFANPARLKTWLAALPLGNTSKTGHELLAALYQVNRAKLPLNHRYALLEHIRPIIASLLPALHKQYDSAPIPLPEKQGQAAELARSLLREMGSGYKISLLELAAAPASDAVRSALIAASYHAVDHLARLLVESYSIYAPEPKKFWLEVNQLYRYAELNGFHLTELGQNANGFGGVSIGRAYRRLLLLALANPYHLMQGEALQVYNELVDWTQACRIQPLGAGNSAQGYLFVDLEADAPPRYAPTSFAMPLPLDGRILDISAILPLIERRIKEVTLAHKSESGQLTLMGRTQRNMYKRLAEAWGVRSERLSDRKRRDAPVTITIGISACHHFSSGGVEFAPEAREIDLRRGGAGAAGSGLSLISTDDSPWLSEDKTNRLATGIVQPRTSQFINAQGKNSKDVWVKVYSTQAQHEHEKGSGPGFDNTTCLLQDESAGGMAIECGKDHKLRMNVGEVMAFLTEDEHQNREWSIGTVRWLRLSPEDELGLGIRVLADDALPAATRGVRGAGRGGEYFRSLLIPKLDPSQFPTTLITPAAIYDVDSIILINTGEQLLYAHLTKLLEATNAYAQFQFLIVPPPEDEATPTAPVINKGNRAI